MELMTKVKAKLNIKTLIKDGGVHIIGPLTILRRRQCIKEPSYNSGAAILTWKYQIWRPCQTLEVGANKMKPTLYIMEAPI